MEGKENWCVDSDCINWKIRNMTTGHTISVYDKSLYKFYGDGIIFKSMDRIIEELEEGKLKEENIYSRAKELQKEWKR